MNDYALFPQCDRRKKFCNMVLISAESEEALDFTMKCRQQRCRR